MSSTKKTPEHFSSAKVYSLHPAAEAAVAEAAVAEAARHEPAEAVAAQAVEAAQQEAAEAFGGEAAQAAAEAAAEGPAGNGCPAGAGAWFANNKKRGAGVVRCEVVASPNLERFFDSVDSDHHGRV
jgi:hypothetical protein